jgi:hypothetical protein
MYIADSLAAYKIRRDGVVHKIGVAPPTVTPIAELDRPLFDKLLNFQSTTGWTSDGTVCPGTGFWTTPNRINTTTTKVIYDSGVNGWCCIVPASMSNIGVGSLLDVTYAGPSTETVIVYEAFRGSSATTIASVAWDDGSVGPGMCTIRPANSLNEIKRNAVILINGTIYSRITDVISGPDGSIAFRCSNPAFGIGISIQVINSFRVYSLGGFAANGGDVLAQKDLSFGILATGTGYIQNNTALDLTKMSVSLSSTGGALYDDDYIHIAFKCSDLSKLTQGRIMFNCDATDTTFAQNYYYRSFTPNDLLLAAKGTLTSLDTQTVAINNNTIDTTQLRSGPILSGKNDSNVDNLLADADQRLANLPQNRKKTGDVDPNSPNTAGTTRSQTATGDNQWSEIRFKRADLQRVGTANRGYADITGFRLELTISALAVTIDVNSLTIWGSSEPDTGDIGEPYQYRYRYRVSSTGACSNFSPANFSGVNALRTQVIVAMTASTAPEVDKIDIERRGGTSTEWTFIGTVSNSVHQFTDTISDDAAIGNAPLSDGDTNFQPWPVRLAPISVTASIVGGCVIKTLSALPTGLLKGTAITVNGIATTFRRMLSAGVYELSDSIGNTTGGVTVEVPEPVITSPLSALWGPWKGRALACGDDNNPGTLYISNGNNFDSTLDILTLEITSPSEPLINGCEFNGRCYVFSSERMFEIEQIGDNQFIYSEVPNAKGLWSRWALAVGSRIFFEGKDGLYGTMGGPPISITDQTLFPLFPNEGNLGVSVNGFNPPNVISGQEKYHRVSYYDNYVYFDYKDTQGGYRSLMFTADSSEPGWYPDVYTPGVSFHYGEEGKGVHSILCGGTDTTTGNLYQLSGTSDNGTAINWHLGTPAFDAQDRRAKKRWGDFAFKSFPDNSTINLALKYNNYSSAGTISPATITGAQEIISVHDINSGVGTEQYNAALDITGAISGNAPKLYWWEPSYIYRPEDSFLRGTDWDDLGLDSDKYIYGLHITTNTQGLSRTVRLEYDGGQLGALLTINHNGYLTNPYPFDPFIARRIRFLPTDPNSWQEFKYQIVFEPEPPLVAQWGPSQQTSFGYDGYFHLREAYITLTNSAPVTLTITRADDGQQFTYTIPPGTRKKTYLQLNPIKAKGIYFEMTSSANFRVYKDDIAFMVKPWASQQQFRLISPFGFSHGGGEAKI